MQTTTAPSASILLIDNEPMTLARIAAILDFAGHHCHPARDAEATVEALEHRDWDLIICNVLFEGNSNPALYRRLTKAGHERNMPLVLIVDSEPPEAARQAARQGTSWLLSRPVPTDELLAVVGRALAAGREGASMRGSHFPRGSHLAKSRRFDTLGVRCVPG